MSTFEVYFQLGYRHILDWNAYDHLLFVIALCLVHQIKHWRVILILITAFTLGHSATLALASLRIVTIESKWIEFLIPCTILITAILPIRPSSGGKGKSLWSTAMTFKYLLVLFFGLIHGLGFSGYLRSLLGQEEDIIFPLFAFNLGLEAGQILIVMAFMIFSWFVHAVFRPKQQQWTLLGTGIIIGIALTLVRDTWPWS